MTANTFFWTFLVLDLVIVGIAWRWPSGWLRITASSALLATIALREFTIPAIARNAINSRYLAGKLVDGYREGALTVTESVTDLSSVVVLAAALLGVLAVSRARRPE